MGANQFINKKSAKTAVEAFRALVEEARCDSGHSGYTGTIAEKDDFRMVSAGATPTLEFVEQCFDDSNHWCQDKWGPAACVDAGVARTSGHRIYVFFGFASS